MRRDEAMVAALLDHGADANAPLKTWTPTRRSSEDFQFEASLVGATPFWLAGSFEEPQVMRMLVDHGADPLFVLVKWVASQGTGQQERTQPQRVARRHGRARRSGEQGFVRRIGMRARRRSGKATLETVKLAVELGVDVEPRARTAAPRSTARRT